MSEEKNNLLLKLQNTYCRPMVSAVSGVGVIAVRNIPKGVNVFQGICEPKWHRLNASELQHLGQEVLTMIEDFFVIEQDGTVQIPEFGLNGMDISYFVNNSVEPNLKVEYIDDHMVFVTLREIQKGEELTFCYAEHDHRWS